MFDEQNLASTIFDNMKIALDRRERYLRISKQLSEDNPKDDLNLSLIHI